ncbi:MAG: hypothetical protein Kow0059_13120 [Candidatus Sumerlaeia bacterium]
MIPDDWRRLLREPGWVMILKTRELHGTGAEHRARGRLTALAVMAACVLALAGARFPAPAQTISIVQPNAASAWQRGSAYEIKWSTTGSIDSVRIEYSLNDGLNWTQIVAQTPNDGSHFWTIPPSLTPSNQARIRISDTFNAAVSATSERFRIVESGDLRVLVPNGGEVWGTGTTHRIQWTSALSIANVRLDVSINGGTTFFPIVTSTPNTGSFDWAIPPNYADSNRCLIRVSNAAAANQFDISDDYFTIAPLRSITITFPNGGEVLFAGVSYNITWSSVGEFGNVDISISTNNGATWGAIVENWPNLGYYNWRIPDAFAGQGNVLIRIASRLLPSVADRSDAPFAIVRASSITMLNPNGGESLFHGETYGLAWFAPNSISMVKLDVSLNGGQSWQNIVAATPNTGKYFWPPPADLGVSCNALIRVSNAANTAQSDSSDAPFCLLSRSLRITVTSPDGGEVWPAGQTRRITWTWGGDIAQVDIFLSQNAGADFTPLATGVANTGAWDWLIPASTPPGDQNLIRVAAAGLGGVSDTSNAPFTLIAHADDDAQVATAIFPNVMLPGSTATAFITMRNTGSTTWSAAGGYGLQPVDGAADPFASGQKFGITGGREIAPGQSFTFNATLEAPTTPGRYTTRWTMHHNLYGTFGETAEGEIEVQGPPLQWLFAEGATLGDIQPFVLVVNPNAEDAATSLTLLPDQGPPLTLSFITPARRRLTIKVDDFLDDVSMGFDLRSNNGVPLFAERAMYWGSPEWWGGHVSVGTTRPSPYWLLAEGATFPIFEEYVLISNPSETQSAELSVRLLRQNGLPPIQGPLTIPPRSRHTLFINHYVFNESVSTEIVSTNGVGVVAERAMYWNVDGRRWTDGHASIGVTQPSPVWYFAGGDTQGSFETYFLVANPGPTDAVVDVTFYYPDTEPQTAPVTVPAAGRYTLLANLVRRNTPLGAKFAARDGAGIVCERATYWDVDGVRWGGGHATVGAPAPATKWFVVEGNALGAFTEIISILNPGDQNADITFTYILDNRNPVIVNASVPARRQQTFLPRLIPSLQGLNFSVQVESTNAVPVVVERAMYWDSSAHKNELGHASLAIPLN